MEGVVQQYAPPQETYDHPSNQFVAGFIGSPAMNFLPATVSREDGNVVLGGAGFRLALPGSTAPEGLPERVIMGVRPEDLDGPAPSAENAITLTVSVTEQLGHALLVYGNLDETQVVASLDPHRRVEIDSTVHLQVNLDTLHVFDPETMETLI
jgi:multiple sugar transport system ATP-binding protein